MSRGGEEEPAENGQDDYMAGVSNREAMVRMGDFRKSRYVSVVNFILSLYVIHFSWRIAGQSAKDVNITLCALSCVYQCLGMEADVDLYCSLLPAVEKKILPAVG